MDYTQTDFIVIGSGLAGLTSALNASKFGNVTLLTKSSLDVSNSYWAQGGIAAAIGSDDCPEFHFNDTIKAGVGLCNPESVKILVEEGVERINELIQLGMKFDLANGAIELGLEGNHTKRRVLHAGGDATGRELVKFVLQHVLQNQRIKATEYSLVLDLLVENNNCYGVRIHNWVTGKSEIITAPAIIIATGGASGMYSRTTNPHSTTGDGIILAYNAGAEISNMEFVQFHPSSLLLDSDETFLISEAVRGEGAHLVNCFGERFMSDKHELAELAPRDVVAYEMHKQYQMEGNRVYLKLDHLDPQKIQRRFSNIYKELLRHNIDLTKDLVPVAPAAHYLVGGIKTGLYGETNINNLYAVGEVSSTGVHGANRLASNSLLECLVFAKRAVEHSLENKFFVKYEPVNYKKYFVDKTKEETYLSYKNKIAVLLSQNVGIIRNESDLNKTLTALNEIYSSFLFEENEYYSLRLMSLITVAQLIIKSALIRKESRGGHRREDYPQLNDQYLCEIIHRVNFDPQIIGLR